MTAAVSVRSIFGSMHIDRGQLVGIRRGVRQNRVVEHDASASASA
jgi:hypothetical protein